MPGKLLLILILILVAFMVAGCAGPVSFNRLTDDAYPPRSAEMIEVFIGEQSSRRYTRIALITTNLRKENFAANIDAIKRQAAELGADAIILISAQQRTLGSVLSTDDTVSPKILGFDGDTGYSYSVYAIKYVKQK